jgi:hypothetical protein
MNKHFLVTISNDANILYGVRFVCSFFNHTSSHQITLLHICMREGQGMAGAMGQMWDNPSDTSQGQLSVQARKSINKARELLSQQKMSIDQVMIKTSVERYGKIKDILLEGAKGSYDAIVLGRRASYSLQWMFERPADETAQTIIRDSACTTPLWICPEPKSDRKNILLCLDGSENSLRAVDHVGFILGNQDHQQITLFHVETSGPATANEIFTKAETILHRYGIGSERINRRATGGLTVAGTILSELDKGGYAAVAVGLHGEKLGLAKSLNLAGSTTAKLISKIEKASLWCCP